MMRFSRATGWWSLPVLLFLLAACSDDATTVGIDLIEEQSGDPFVVDVLPSSVTPEERVDITGNMPRILAGSVTDPLFGTHTAIGYFDFTAPTDVEDAFRAGPISDVTLVLRPNYLYGDTTATLRLNIREIPTAWNELGTGADTTVAVGDVITTFSFAATDTLLNITLPQEWTTARQSVLISESFPSQFNGLAFEVAEGSGNAVIGFETTNTGLEVTSGGELERYGVVQTLTTLRTEGNAPEDALLLRDGISQALAVSFDLEAADLDANPINRAVMRFPLDMERLATDLPPHFVRPPVERVGLFVLVDGTPQLIEEVAPNANGTLTFTDPSIRTAIQRTALGTSTFETYQLAIPSSVNSINALFFEPLADGNPDNPSLILTITPTE